MVLDDIAAFAFIATCFILHAATIIKFMRLLWQLLDNHLSTQKLGIGAGGGGAYSISCDLHEVIVYNKVLTTGEVANVENYLTNRYT